MISWGDHSFEDALDGLVVVLPLIQKRLRGGLTSAGLLGWLWRCLAVTGSSLLRLVLALAALGRAGRGDRPSRCGNLANIIVDSLHVVAEIPLSWEPIALLSALTAFIGAQEWLVSMTM